MMHALASSPILDPSFALALTVGLGLLGGIGLGVKAVMDRKGLQAAARATNAKAETDAASAASILTSAARELIDPLRQELAQERMEHAGEIEEERKKVQALRRELNAALADLTSLRAVMRRALDEVEWYKTRNVELERELILLRTLHDGS